MVRAGSLLQTLEPSAAWGAAQIAAVALRDLNGDGAPDLIAVLSTIQGAGPCSSSEFQVPFVALLNEDRFATVPETVLWGVPHGLSEDCVARRVTVSTVAQTLGGRL